MISVICVYNDERIFTNMLNKCLQKQTAKFELISVNNTEVTFKSAAKALNYMGRQAQGGYLMFVHQDVILPSERWLEDTEIILAGISDLGVAGCAGVDENGQQQGFIRDRYHLWGKPFAEPKEVQTLDESVLIVPHAVFRDIQFDEENFTGWHCYGADYCLRAMSRGLGIYVIPSFIYHNSLNVNIAGLSEQQKILLHKHKAKYRHIYTTSGSLSSAKIKARPLIEILRRSYVRVFPQFLGYLGKIIRKELSGCESVLDIGWQRDFPIQSVMGGLEHVKVYSRDIITIDWKEFNESSFDAVIALDILHHLPKEEGHGLVKKMEGLARNKMILLCPNGSLYPNNLDFPELQKASWSPLELRSMGFKVLGINGWKPLRSYTGGIEFQPWLFWQLLSDLSQTVVRHSPKHSFELFCVKETK